MIKRSLTLIVLVFNCIWLHCQTNLPSVINTNMHLTTDGSPYIVDSGLTVNLGDTLTIDAGVEVLIDSNVNLTINGSFFANGNSIDSIKISSLNNGVEWGMINSTNAHIELNYLTSSGSKSFLNVLGGDLKISHCTVFGNSLTNGYDCIAVHSATRVQIDSSRVTGKDGTIAQGYKSDAIDLDDVDTCLILYNQVSYFSDDALDIGTGTRYALISGNWLYHCNYGISVGENSLAYADNNALVGNDAGIEVHTGAIVHCSHSIFYSNLIGISAYHAEATGETGGNIYVSSCIFSSQLEVELDTLESSTVVIEYSLSDSVVLPGESNLTGNPGFKNPDNFDFTLKDDSPCIGKGKPDGLGTATNIGLEIDAPVIPIGLSERNNPYSIYPNPAKDYIIIKSENDPANCLVSISNIQGQILLTIYITDSYNYIPIYNLQPGIYFITMNNSLIKMIKE